jgi:CubicO group peptidase (beta-lactamase class C family)
MAEAKLSEPSIERLRSMLESHVAHGYTPGAVALVGESGENYVLAVGAMAFGDAAPMRRDTLFRIASMTKPITAAAAMMLVEDGKLALDEPVDRLVPELADRRVLRSIDAPLDDTVAAKRPIPSRTS